MKLATPKIGISGHPTIQVIDKSGRVKFDSSFENMVLDHFFTDPVDIPSNGTGNGGIGGLRVSHSGSRYPIHRHLFLGAEVTTPPSPSDSGLSNQVADRGATLSDIEAGTIIGATPEEDYRWIKTTAEFPEGEVEGNLAEVGLGFSSERTLNGPARTRVDFKTLIKDAAGNPVVVPVTADDRVIVAYELRFYRPPLSVSEPFSLEHNEGQFRFIRTTYVHSSFYNTAYTEWDFSTRDGESNDRMGSAQIPVVGASTPSTQRPLISIPPGNPNASFFAPAPAIYPPATESRSGNCLIISGHRLAYPSNLVGDSRLLGKNLVGADTFGIFVDAETGVPKDIVVPAGYRLEFMLTYPEGVENWAQLLSRR